LDENLPTRILEPLTASPQLKTREIAARLGIDRGEVNSFLYGSLAERVTQDRQSLVDKNQFLSVHIGNDGHTRASRTACATVPLLS
jgi:hypothetical protein